MLGRWLVSSAASASARPPARGGASVTSLRPTPPAPVIDAAAILELCGDVTGEDRDFLREIVTSFRSQTAATRSVLAEAVRARDGIALAFEAHRMKSTCRLFGATIAADLCATLERLGAAGTFTEAEPVLADLGDAFAKVDIALTALVESTNSPVAEARPA